MRNNAPASRTRRAVSVALLAGGAGSILSACATSSGGSAPAGPPAAQALRGTGVEYWQSLPTVHPTEAATIQVMEDLSKNGPYGITVTPVAAAPGNRDLSPKVIAAMAAGTPPNLVSNWNYLTADYFAQGGLVDVDAELKSNAEWFRTRAAAYPALLKGLSWKGKLYGIPFHNSYYAMYYSPGLLQRAGLVPPSSRGWTREQFVDSCRRVAQPPDVTGYDCNWTFSRTGMMSLPPVSTLSDPRTSPRRTPPRGRPTASPCSRTPMPRRSRRRSWPACGRRGRRPVR